MRILLTTDFLNLEAKIIKKGLKKIETNEKRIYRTKMLPQKKAKNFGKAMIFHRISHSKLQISPIFPYFVD